MTVTHLGVIQENNLHRYYKSSKSVPLHSILGKVRVEEEEKQVMRNFLKPLSCLVLKWHMPFSCGSWDTSALCLVSRLFDSWVYSDFIFLNKYKYHCNKFGSSGLLFPSGINNLPHGALPWKAGTFKTLILWLHENNEYGTRQGHGFNKRSALLCCFYNRFFSTK